MSKPISFQELAKRALAGETLSPEDGLAILRASDDELPELLGAALRVREAHFGRFVRMQMLINAKSGHCGEDCGYCSQSKDSTAPINKYPLQSKEALLDGAEEARNQGAGRFCIVTSGDTLNKNNLEQLQQAVRYIKDNVAIPLCCSVGSLNEEQAAVLKEAGVGWINHNLNTSRGYYKEICGTHTYDDRVETLRTARKAGLRMCSGGIIGMGESDQDVVEMALACRELDVDTIPLNFYHPIEGTPLTDRARLTPEYCLKALCLFRLVNPTKELRIAGGRELHLGEKTGLALNAANSLFFDGYLTTSGNSADETKQMIEDAGFVVVEGIEGQGSYEQEQSTY